MVLPLNFFNIYYSRFCFVVQICYFNLLSNVTFVVRMLIDIFTIPKQHNTKSSLDAAKSSRDFLLQKFDFQDFRSLILYFFLDPVDRRTLVLQIDLQPSQVQKLQGKS